MFRFAAVMLVLFLSTGEPLHAQVYGGGSITGFGSQYGGTVTFSSGTWYPPNYYTYPPPVIVSPPGYYGYYPAPVYVIPPRYYDPPRHHGHDHRDRRPGTISINPNKPQEHRPPVAVTKPRPAERDQYK